MTDTLSGPGGTVHVQPRVMDLAAYLAKRPEKVVAREELIEAVWQGYPGADQSLSNAASKLRKALSEVGGDPDQLQTAPKRGYRLTGSVEPSGKLLDTGATSAGLRRNAIVVAAVVVAVVAAALLFTIFPFKAESTKPGLIAVLPFDNYSPREEDAYFAHGMTEETTTRLSQLSGLRVIARSAVTQFIESGGNVTEMNQALGVSTYVEGSARMDPSGKRVRITAQLVDAATSEHLWAETYDRELTAENILTIQSEIVGAISEALETTLTPEERAGMREFPTRDLQAYKAYLLGRNLTERGTWDSIRRAIELFEEAVGRDPQFAEAWVGIARAKLALADSGAIAFSEVLDEVEPSLSQALAIDNELAEAYAIRGTMYSYSGSEEALIMSSFKRALELDPNNVEALYRQGRHLHERFRPAQALPLLEKAAALNPMSTSILYGLQNTQRRTNRLDEAEATLARIRAIDPADPSGYYGMTWTSFRRGHLGEGMIWALKAARLDPSDADLAAFIGERWLDLGDLPRAEGWMARACELEVAFCDGPRLWLYLFRGQKPEALTLARRLLAASADNQVALRVVRDHALETGAYEKALNWYRLFAPELFEDPPRESNSWRVGVFVYAVDLAYLYQRMGEEERAAFLANQILADIRSYYSQTLIQEARLVIGDTEGALDNLRILMDERWYLEWWWWRSNPLYDRIREYYEFKAMIAAIEADISAQHEQVLAWIAAQDNPG